MNTNHDILLIQQTDLKYETISTKCLMDKSLSWKAKGLHTYFMCSAKSETMANIDLKISTDGLNSVSSGIKELINAGYLFRIVLRENGKIKKWSYVAFEEPELKENIVDRLPSGWRIENKK